MSTKHIVVAGIVAGGLVPAVNAASVSLFTDSRSVEADASAGHPAEPAEDRQQAAATPGDPFRGAIDLNVTSPDLSTSVTACAEQTSSLVFDDHGGFVFTGSLFAETSTAFEPVEGGAVTPYGYGSPASIFDIVLDVTGHYKWELELSMDTQGDAAASFSAFDFSSAITPFGRGGDSFKLAGDIETGRFRILANVVAPTDPSFDGSMGKIDFVLRGAVGAPMPTAVAVVCAMMAATLLPRKR